VKEVMDNIGETNKANFNRDVRKCIGFKVALADAGISPVLRGKAGRCVGFQRDIDEGEPQEPDDPADIFRHADV
jgi:hypothetical protein